MARPNRDQSGNGRNSLEQDNNMPSRDANARAHNDYHAMVTHAAYLASVIAARAFTSTLMAKHSLSSTLPKSPRPTQPFSASPSITLPASCKCDLAAHGVSFVTSLTQQTRCSTDKPCARAAGEGGRAFRLHDPHGPTASDLGSAAKDAHEGCMRRRSSAVCAAR